MLVRILLELLRFRGFRYAASLSLTVKSYKPRSFQEKILYKMKHDRNKILGVIADKVEVREFIKERISERYLATCIGVYSSLEGVKRAALPRNFVIKANHGSGALVICWHGAPRGVQLPKTQKRVSWETYLIHPDDLNWEDLVNLGVTWMNQNYYWGVGRFPEWAYSKIEPKMLVEEVLLNEELLPNDYKFFMIDGECKLIYMTSSRFNGLKVDLYTERWEKLDASWYFPRSDKNSARPENLPEMLHIARELSRGQDFIRVDLYQTDRGIVVGELTLYPFGGLADIKPRKLSVKLAKDWNQLYPPSRRD